MSGRFISLEGGEGVGKSTQASRLREALQAMGLDVVLTREPGGSGGAEAIRALLLEGPDDRWDAGTEALLFAAARADHVARTIRPALAAGRWVVCDRFLDSSRAYQGAAAAIGEEAVWQLHAIGSGGLLPDRTLVLDLPDDVSAARAAERDCAGADRIGRRGSGFHASVAEAFRAFAQQEPRRIRVIDARGDKSAVSMRLLDAISDLLP